MNILHRIKIKFTILSASFIVLAYLIILVGDICYHAKCKRIYNHEMDSYFQTKRFLVY